MGLSFSLEEVLRRVRCTNKPSAGGLSGSNYKTLECPGECSATAQVVQSKTMKALFYQSDSLAENLATLLNRIAAGRVPA